MVNSTDYAPNKVNFPTYIGARYNDSSTFYYTDGDENTRSRTICKKKYVRRKDVIVKKALASEEVKEEIVYNAAFGIND